MTSNKICSLSYESDDIVLIPQKDPNKKKQKTQDQQIILLSSKANTTYCCLPPNTRSTLLHWLPRSSLTSVRHGLYKVATTIGVLHGTVHVGILIASYHYLIFLSLWLTATVKCFNGLMVWNRINILQSSGHWANPNPYWNYTINFPMSLL